MHLEGTKPFNQNLNSWGSREHANTVWTTQLRVFSQKILKILMGTPPQEIIGITFTKGT